MIFSAYYWLIFAGIFFLGDIAVVPMLYLAVNGTLLLPVMVLFVFIANLLSDIAWWIIGLKIPSEKILNSRFVSRNKSWVDKISESFHQKGWRLLAYSKFIYGIRPIVRVLCGVYKMSFRTYMLVNTATTVAWIILISGLAFFFRTSISALDNAVSHLEIAIAFFVICVALFDFWLNDVIKRRLGLNGSNTKNPKQGDPDGNRNI
jgi:membrane protein DedA with SNARE-associated domain